MKKITMTRQNKAVLEYLQKYGTITNAEAFEHLKITRLSARIYDLRHMGYEIPDQMRTRRAETGEIIRWKEYRLAA